MRMALLGSIALALSACGGDDSGPSPSPTPSPTPTPPQGNRAPAFTSPPAASVVENQISAHRVLATDADSDPITLTIAGGNDAGLFSLDVTGNLTFRSAPNFEAPADANGDNIYEITLNASDGRTHTTQDLRITVTNDREGIAVQRVASGFVQPIQIYKDPENAGRLYVAERRGIIYSLNLSTGEKSLILTLPSISTDGERGLIGFVVGKDGPGATASPKAFYILATDPAGAINLNAYSGQPGSLQRTATLLNVPHPDYSNHNGGWIDFDSASDHSGASIFVGIGDGGGAGDPNNNAQNPNSRLGKILRIRRSSAPYAGASVSFWEAPAIYASGLRNPFRGTVDNGNIIIGDVGQSGREEINVLPVNGATYNLGWPYLEGTLPYKGTAPANLTLTAPNLQYGHGSGPLQGRSVIGGVVYRGPISSINEHYLFGDFVSGHIWSVPYNRLLSGPLLDGTGYENRKADLTPDVGTINQPVAFGKDSAGNVYIVDFDGEIFKIASAS